MGPTNVQTNKYGFGKLMPCESSGGELVSAVPPDIWNEPGIGRRIGMATAMLADAGEVEIAGRRYVTAERLASMLNVTVRTLGRWNAARIGPPKIKIGKLVLFDVAKLPDWLASREIEPVRARRH